MEAKNIYIHTDKSDVRLPKSKLEVRFKINK